jgi:membrane associated rhomboid family serine protease
MLVTYIILGVTVAVSLWALNDHSIMNRFIFNPYVVQVRKEWYRFLTHGFLHADYVHLLVNMYVLYGFGRIVEQMYTLHLGSGGRIAFVFMYLSSIIVASVSSYIKHKDHPGYNSLGASGATSAVVFAFILFAPWAKLSLLFIPIGIPGIIMGVLYLVYSSYMAKRGGDNIGHDAHFYGAVYGFFYTLLLKPKLGLAFIEQIGAGIGIK